KYLKPVVFGKRLPRPARGTRAGEDGSCILELKNLASYVLLTRDYSLSRHGIEGPRVIDRGGGRNLFTATQGHPRWGFVYVGPEIYELFKPGMATGHEGGLFHEFLR